MKLIIRLMSIFLMVGLFLGSGMQAAISPITANTKIYFADVNNDQLLDVVVGELDLLTVYLNVGTAQNPSFQNVFYNMPADPIFDRMAGTFFDIDYDGDFDLFFATQNGTIGWRRNVGTKTNPSWSELVKSGTYGDSFNNIDIDWRIQMLNFIDFDGDGDLDMVFNDSNGTMYYYLNKDKENDGWVDGQGVTWTRITSGLPLANCGGDSAKHHWVDEDGDGDFDILSGLSYGGIRLDRNNGSPTSYGSFSMTVPAYASQVQGQSISPFLEDFNGDGFKDLYFTYSDGVYGYSSLISAITRVSPNDIDDIPPVMAANALAISSLQSNTIILRWPYIYDSPNSSYRSGIKSYTLYRSTQGSDFTPSPQNQLWKHYQSPHFPDDVHEFPDGDKFKIEGGNFYYKDAALQGGNTYYYKLIVEDYAGNAAETDPVSQELAPPELTAVNVQLTPLTSSNSMLLSVTTVDQYGMDYPINTNPTNGLPNVTFQVYEGGQPADYTLYDLDAQANLTSTTFTGVSNRTFNVTYRPSEPCITFTVRAEATNWISSEVSETVHGDSAAAKIDRGKPPLPGNVRALSTEITMNSITVRWDSVTDGCTSVAYYKIYGKRADAPSYALLSQPTGLVYTQSNLAAGTSYRYYVTAVDSVGLESNVTDPAAISIQATTLIDITPPTVPTGLTAVYISGNTQIQISWGASTDSDTGVHYYEIQRKMGEEGLFETVQTINHPTLTWVHDQSYPGYPIYFRVRAVDNVGNASDWSITATADVGGDRTPPSVPTNVQGQALSTTSIRVTWNASTDNTGGSGLRSYKIYRNYGTTSIAEVTATSYTNSGLTPNTEYTYQVTAVDNAGNESAKSSAVAVQTQQDPTLIQPNPPQSLHQQNSQQHRLGLDCPGGKRRGHRPIRGL
jgi:fibronectin type 3 domain-containing protein